MRRRVVACVAVMGVVVGGALLGACGAAEKAEKAGEDAVEKSIADAAKKESDDVEDVEVDSDAGTITIEGKDGTLVLGEDLPLPEGFPATLPLPEGGHTVNAVAGEEGAFEVSMFVTDPDLGAHEQRIRAGLDADGYTVGATRDEVLDGVPQRVVPATGHRTAVEVRLGVAVGRATVHYSVTPRG